MLNIIVRHLNENKTTKFTDAEHFCQTSEREQDHQCTNLKKAPLREGPKYSIIITLHYISYAPLGFSCDVITGHEIEYNVIWSGSEGHNRDYIC